MHLTREALDTFASHLRQSPTEARHWIGDARTLIRLEEGDSMGTVPALTGPAIVELVVYRDGGWSARELVYETPESIALAASLSIRQRVEAGELGVGALLSEVAQRQTSVEKIAAVRKHGFLR
jgi:hypothetical protein